MKFVTTEAVMTALCQHCDSHIELCEDCPMKELIESVPEAWIKCSERLPEKGVDVLVFSWNTTLTRVWTLTEDGDWEDEYGYLQDFVEVTHWMPLPDAPEVEG